MPASSPQQQRFMGRELARARAGLPTSTGMSQEQLRDFASSPRTMKRPVVRARRTRRGGRY